jgi:glycerate 2-kinase
MGFFDVALKKGIDLILDASGIKNEIRDADLLITGEGKIDKQTLQGKVVSELSQLAHNNKIPAIGFCGILDADDTMIKQLHLQFVGCLTNASVTKHDAMLRARDLLINKAGEFFRDYYSSK